MEAVSKSRKSRILPILISILITFLTSELFSYLILEFEVNGFPDRTATQELLANKRADQRIVLEIQTDTPGANVLHPYWGFAMNRDKLHDINRLGLNGPVPPKEKTENRLVVAILGGSVALELAGYKDLVLSALQSVPRFQGKEILLLPYAMSGGKQPQQIFQITYLLTLGYHFDVVINLDGFNELTLPYVDNMKNNVAGSYPRNWRLYSRLGLDATLSELMYHATELEHERRSLYVVFSIAPLHSLNTTLFIYNLIERFKANRFREVNAEIQRVVSNQKPSFQTSGPFTKVDKLEEVINTMAGLWIRSSVQLDLLCRSNGIEYYHFLQPNQYLYNSKPMLPEEIRVAIRRDHPYGQVAARFYPHFIEAGKSIAVQGVHFTDLTKLFADEERIVYKDNCCHFNELGNRMLIERIAKTILETPVEL